MKHLGFVIALLGLIIAFVCGAALLVLAFKQPAVHNALVGIAAGSTAFYGGRALMSRPGRTDPKAPEAPC